MIVSMSITSFTADMLVCHRNMYQCAWSSVFFVMCDVVMENDVPTESQRNPDENATLACSRA